MNIDYVVISSDDNPLYKDFYPVVAKQWNKLGYKVFYINITYFESEIEDTEYGLIKHVRSINKNTGFQSQIVRMYASILLKDENILISDIDMLPLNGEYFSEKSKGVSTNKVLFYSGQPYGNVPYYPMCYILGRGELISNFFEIDDNYNDFVNKLSKFSNMDWNTDEKYIYTILNDNTNKMKDCIILRDRNFNRRINRFNDGWDKKFTTEQLKNGYFIDSHLLRPYQKYETKIKELLCY